MNTIPLNFPTRHAATSSGGAELLFECGSCGFEAPVDVRARGLGFGLDAGGDDDARSAADRSRYHNANAALCFARCPRCTRRRWGGIAAFLLTELVVGGMLGVAIGVAGATFAWGSEASAPVIGLVPVGAMALSLGARALLLWTWLPDAIASVKFGRAAA